MIISMFQQFKDEKRIPAVDFMKLFASVLVILSHCMLKYIDSGDSNPLYNLIWLTQMPLFMFASGMVTPKASKVDSFSKYLLRVAKNALTLLIPYLTYLLFSSLISHKNIASAFVDFYRNPDSNLWFLWVLFLIHLFFDFGIWLSTRIQFRFSAFLPDLIVLFISAGVVLLMFLYKSFDYRILGIKLLAYYIPFFVFGHLVSAILKKVCFTPRVKAATVSVFGIALGILTFECFFFESVCQFSDFDIKYVLIRVVGSLSAIIVFLFLSDLLTSRPFFSKLSKYGMFSLQSYYIHLLFIRLLNYNSASIGYQWLIAFGTAGLLIVIVIGTLFILYNIPYAHFIIFGKSFSRYSFEKDPGKTLG